MAVQQSAPITCHIHRFFAAMLDLLSWKEAELQNLPYRDGEYASISIREREVYVLISIIEGELVSCMNHPTP